MNQTVSINPKQLLAWLGRSHQLITTLVILGLFGYTGYQISHITAVQPSQAYVTSKQATDKVPSLRVNQDVLKQLKQLQSPGSTSIQVTTGKQDPFSLN